MIRRLFILFWFVYGCGILSAQLPHYRFRHLTTNEGLSDGKINSVGQDKYGFIWIATGYGLNRYNGYEIELFSSAKDDSTTIPNNLIRSQHTSASSNIYFTSPGGLSRYVYARQEFEQHPFGIQNTITIIAEPEPGTLWMYGSDGLFILDESTGGITMLNEHPDTLIRTLARTQILDMASADGGILYFATSSGLFRLDTRTWSARQYTHDENDPSTICSNDLRNIAVDHEGMVWIATDYYGSRLTRFDPVKGTFQRYDQFYAARKDWADNRIMDLLVDSHGRLWIASLRAGLALYNPGSDDFHFHTHDPMDAGSLASNAILSIFEDKEGALWVGTEDYGVDYFQPDHDYFTTITVSSRQSPTLPDPACRAVAVDKNGHYWIGTYKGLSQYNPITDAFSNYLLTKEENPDANNSVRSLLVDDEGIVWVGTGGGLYRLNPETKKEIPFTEKDSMPIVYISQIIQDRNKNIWITTPRGLFIYNRETRTFGYGFTTKETSQYRTGYFSNIYEDRAGHIWLCMPRKGVIVYNPQNGHIREYAFSFLHPQMQANDFITSISEDLDGQIWLSSLSGLISLNPDSNITRQYVESDGLPSNKVSGVLVDSLNRIWIGTGKGLCMLEADKHTFHSFDAHDGLPTNYFYEGNAYKMPDGTFAYPTYNGVVLFRPEQIIPNAHDVSLLLTSFTIAGVNPHLETAIPELREVELSYDENFFSIEMTGLHFANPSKITYAYILEGFDPAWHYTKERRVNYTNVPGGKYVFRFKASENPMSPDVREQTLVILIGTVFYKTWWFILIAGLLLALLIYGFIRWRLLEQNKIYELENKAQLLEKEKAMVMYENLKQHLNPHFLFNSLTSLKSLIRLDQKSAGEFLERMSKIYRYILKSRDHELVSLKDEVTFAQTYIDLQQARFEKGLQVNIAIDEAYDHYKIAPVTLQNLIENAIKHNLIDEDMPLVIDIYIEGDYLVVQNNLQKKEFVETSNKQGLVNMQSLYRYLDPRPFQIMEDTEHFTVKIPLI